MLRRGYSIVHIIPFPMRIATEIYTIGVYFFGNHQKALYFKSVLIQPDNRFCSLQKILKGHYSTKYLAHLQNPNGVI